MTSHIEELNAPYVRRNFIKQCPLCGSAQLRLLFKTEDFSYTHDEYDLIRCQPCKMTLTQNHPTEAWISAYYQSDNYVPHTDTRAQWIHRLYHRARSWRTGRKLRLARGKGKPSELRLLDIGAGTGYFVQQARKRGWTAEGIELSPQARERARELRGIELLPSEALFSQAEQYDTITLWQSLSALHSLHQSLEQVHKLLKPGGRLLIAAPNTASLDAAWYGKYWAAWDVPRHLWHFQPQNMEQLLRDHGFSLRRKKSMLFDSLYICLLSERYRGKKLGMLRGLIKGSWAFFLGIFSARRCSSIVYIAQHS